MSTTSSPRSGSGRVVATLAIVFGAIIALGTVGSAAASTLTSAAVADSSRTIAVDGVDRLSLDLSAGQMRVEFADVEQAELSVTAGVSAQRWTLRRDGDELVVRTPQGLFGWSGWGSWGMWGGHGYGDAVLRLPHALAGMDADLGISAGTLTVAGDFGTLTTTLGAGALRVSGSAREVSADISAGRADLTLADVGTGDLQISAGQLNATLTGSQPQHLALRASAGSMDVGVPAGDYAVTEHTSAGSFENRIGSTPGAGSAVQVDVSAGRIVLERGGR
ncbi:hypothetical protein GCM10022240_08280 [Microbacterium kribbense]|uniref:Adhesin domain-containing protein n=1 Tax=Microbacterium kribbense TaxID=433645 RepID=A0ABP7G6U9_9MICO